MINYFSIEGTATRKQYWITNIVVGVLSVVVAIVTVVARMLGLDLLANLAMLMIVPILWLTIAVAARRCNDAGVSRYWALLTLVPYAGAMFAASVGLTKTKDNA